MPKISEMAAPASALSGLELIPILQGGGSDANAGLPLLATRSVPSGAVLILRKPMTADLSATTDADPGAGKVRWNNATPASATVLYIDDADTASGDIATPLATVQVGGYIYLQANSTSARRDCWQKWQVTSLTDATGYTKVGVSYVAGAGTWAADETLELTVQQPTPAVSDPNIVTTITSGTITPAGDTDLVRPAALTAALTIANPSSTPADGAGLVVDLIDNGTTRALTWGSKYASCMATMPTTTTVSKRHRIGFEYNAGDDKLYCMYAQVQP